MPPGSEDEQAAVTAGRGHLRASHADRGRVIRVLQAAFVQGRLTKDEFDARVGQAFAARTYGDLAALTADLPAGLAVARPPGGTAPVTGRPAVKRALMWSACVIVVLGAVLVAVSGPPMYLGGSVPMAMGVLAILIAAPVAWDSMLDLRRQRRSGGQLPPRRARRRPALGDEPGGGTGGGPVLCEAIPHQARARPLPGRGVAGRCTRWPLMTGGGGGRPAGQPGAA